METSRQPKTVCPTKLPTKRPGTILRPYCFGHSDCHILSQRKMLSPNLEGKILSSPSKLEVELETFLGVAHDLTPGILTAEHLLVYRMILPPHNHPRLDY